MTTTALVLFRDDLRLADNPALAAACAHHDAVVPVFFLDAEEPHSPGAAARYWLHQSLRALEESLRERGSRLLLRTGQEVLTLVNETGAQAVYWNRRYAPGHILADATLKARLQEAGIAAHSFNANLLLEPWEVHTTTGGHFRVFTPFWRACNRLGSFSEPLPAPQRIPAPERWPASLMLKQLNLEPRIDWAGGIREHWTFGEAAAMARLQGFLHERVAHYGTQRDMLAEDGVSGISPHLRFGEISPRQVLHCAQEVATESGVGVEAYLRQIFWREFAYHLLYHEPQTIDQPLHKTFERFPWRDDPEALRRWQRGQTGYPVVDAAMRQLWHTGWMHNRARMVVGSFLVKHLLIDWREGANWFWDTLVDADLANNTMGWQWIAGSGADAAPYFRVFNPITQGEKFDSEGKYVRRWVPELAGLPDKLIHKPWMASEIELAAAGVTLGKNYPTPIVDHAAARARALDAYASIRI